MILVRQQRADRSHGAVVHHLVDGALKVMHRFHQLFEYRVKQSARLLRVAIGAQLDRALEVGEQNGYLLALAFYGGAGIEDPLGEVLQCLFCSGVAGLGADAEGNALRGRLMARLLAWRRPLSALSHLAPQGIPDQLLDPLRQPVGIQPCDRLVRLPIAGDTRLIQRVQDTARTASARASNSAPPQEAALCGLRTRRRPGAPPVGRQVC